MFINVDAHTFHDRGLVRDVLAASEKSGVALDRVMLELTERTELIADDVTASVLDALRLHGVRIALDDHGSAHSHLLSISMIRPSFVKIGHSFGTDLENCRDRQRVVRHVVALAHDFGCEVVLEGIEAPATVHAAAGLGIELAQGYFFSRPREIWHWAA